MTADDPVPRARRPTPPSAGAEPPAWVPPPRPPAVSDAHLDEGPLPVDAEMAPRPRRRSERARRAAGPAEGPAEGTEGPPAQPAPRKKRKRRAAEQPAAAPPSFADLARASFASIRGRTRAHYPLGGTDAAAAGLEPLSRQRSVMSMALGDLMARVGLQSLSNSLAGQLAAASPAEAQPEMVQVRLGRTSPAPFYPLDPSPADVAAASAAVADLQAQQRAAHAHKKHRKHRRHHNAEGDEHADGPADPADPELGYPQYEDYAHPHHHHHGHRKTRGAPADSAVPEFEYAAVDFAALDPELRFASPLPPPDPEPDEPAPMFLPIPSPPTPSGIPEWLAPLFPPVTALPAFLQLRHPTLGMNVGARAWILTLVALWVILSYLPFFPPSGSATAFSADAANHTLAFDHAGTDIYNVSTFAGYSHFRNIGLLNTNTGQSSFLPAWSEFVSSGANGTRNDTPADACAAFLGSRGWVLPGYTVTGIPDFSVTNDTSTVVVTWNGPMAGRAVPRWNGGPALHSAFEYLDRAINNLTSSPMTFGQPSRSASILRSAPGRMYSKDSDPILAWDDKSTQDVVDGETGDYVNPKTGLRTVVAAGLRWTAVRVKATGTEGGKAAVFVAGMDTPPNDPPPNTLSTPPALLLALLRHLLNPTSPALPYDILLLWTSGTSAPTQHYTLSAPTSAWYADSGMTGLLMQPGFRDFTTSEMWKSAAPAAVVWLGPVGPGALEVDYAAEMRGSWQPSGDGSGRQVWERTRRLQGVPRWGAGSSIGRHLRMRSNVTWNAPFLGPLWDAGFDALSARSMDAGEGERTRFVHAYTRGAIDSADWGARPTHAGLEAVGGWLRGIAADPGQLEADAAYGLDHAGTNYYPLASGMASYSLAGAWAFAGIDMVLATLALAFAFWRRYATEEGSGWGTELGAWCWASALWVIGVGVVGTAVPVGVWWIASFSSTSLRLYQTLGIPGYIPSPSLPLLAAAITLAWSAVSTGESTIAALHTSAMFLLACLNIAGTAMIPESNWFLSFTVLFGVLIGCPLEFWCEEYSRWLVREEDGRHYSRQLAEWERWSAERLREDKEREAAAVPEWLAARRESARNGEGVGVPEWSAAGQSAGAVLSDLVDELLAEAGGYYDAEQPEGHGSQDRLHSASDDAEAVDEEDEEYVEYSPVEIANAEVYRLFYTPHLYHLPTTLFLLVRTAFLPFLALAPIWAAVTAVETTTNPMNSWSLAVGGVPWIAVAPSAAAAIAVAAVVPLWALWSENRVTGRGVEKDWAWLRWLPCIAFFFAFLGCFLAGLLGASKFVDGNGAYPVPTTIGYLMDSSLPFGTASATMFFSMDEAVYTPFTAQFMQFPIAPESFHLVQTSPYLDYGRGMLGLRVKGRQTLQANAPLWSLTTPSVGVVSDLYADNNTDTTKRNLTLLIGGPRGSVHWSVQITAPANVVGLQVWDHKVDLSRPPQRFVTSGAGGAGSAAFSRFHLDCIPCPPDGLQVSMILSSTAGNTTVRMSETGWGLPWKDSSMAFPPFPWEDRSAKEMMGGLWGMSDPTVVFAQAIVVSKVNSSGFEFVAPEQVNSQVVTTAARTTTAWFTGTSIYTGSTRTGTITYSGTGTAAKSTGTLAVEFEGETIVATETSATTTARRTRTPATTTLATGARTASGTTTRAVRREAVTAVATPSAGGGWW